MLRVPEAAIRLGLSRSSLYAMAKAGKIECNRIGPRGGAIRFTEEQIELYLEKTTKREREKPESRKPKPSRPQLRRIRF